MLQYLGLWLLLKFSAFLLRVISSHSEVAYISIFELFDIDWIGNRLCWRMQLTSNKCWMRCLWYLLSISMSWVKNKTPPSSLGSSDLRSDALAATGSASDCKSHELSLVSLLLAVNTQHELQLCWNVLNLEILLEILLQPDLPEVACCQNCQSWGRNPVRPW